MISNPGGERQLPAIFYDLTHRSLVEALVSHRIDYGDIYRRFAEIRPQEAIDRELAHWPNERGKRSGLEVMFNINRWTLLERFLAEPPHAGKDIFAPGSTYPRFINALAGRWITDNTPLDTLTSPLNGELKAVTAEANLWEIMLSRLPATSGAEVTRMVRNLIANGINTAGMVREAETLNLGRERSEAAKVIFDNRDPLWLPR